MTISSMNSNHKQDKLFNNILKRKGRKGPKPNINSNRGINWMNQKTNSIQICIWRKNKLLLKRSLIKKRKINNPYKQIIVGNKLKKLRLMNSKTQIKVDQIYGKDVKEEEEQLQIVEIKEIKCRNLHGFPKNNLMKNKIISIWNQSILRNIKNK